MEVRHTNKFKRDIKRVTKQNKNLSIMDEVIVALAIPEPLDKSFENHPLSGDWSGYNECHLAGDWLLTPTLSFRPPSRNPCTAHCHSGLRAGIHVPRTVIPASEPESMYRTVVTGLRIKSAMTGRGVE
jgi:mRNA interferase YafQ